jgi:hypothetical protein
MAGRRKYGLLIIGRASCSAFGVGTVTQSNTCGGYWPEGHEALFTLMQTSWDQELARYDAVVFLETAAAGGLSISEGNSVRTEDLATAIAIDRRLHAVWSRHPRFMHVPHEQDFTVKLERGLALLRALLA